MAIGFNQDINYGGRTLGSSNDPISRRMRMAEFESYMRQNPGAAPGGTGSTGLAATDHSGWSWILDKQKQYLDDQAALAGKAGPSVKFAGYDGTSGVLAPKRGSMPNAAMKGLDAALSGGRGQDDRLPQWLTDDPAMYDAFKASQLNKFQRGATAGDPGMAAYEDLRARRLYGLEDEALDRDQEYADTMNTADARADAYFTHGEPVARRQNELATELATAKGEAATLDDIIRANASMNAANTRADASKYATDQRSLAAIMNALQREIGNVRMYGDERAPRTGDLTERLDAMTQPGANVGGRSGTGKQPPPPNQRPVGFRWQHPTTGEQLEWDGRGWNVIGG